MKERTDGLPKLSERLGGGMTGTPPVDGVLRWLRRVGVDVGPNDILNALLRTGPHGDRFLSFGRGLSLAKLRNAPHGVDLGGLEPGVKDLLRHRDRRIHLDAAPLLDALRAFAREGPAAPAPGATSNAT